jgi:hypothetical protein
MGTTPGLYFLFYGTWMEWNDGIDDDARKERGQRMLLMDCTIGRVFVFLFLSFVWTDTIIYLSTYLYLSPNKTALNGVLLFVALWGGACLCDENGTGRQAASPRSEWVL